MKKLLTENPFITSALFLALCIVGWFGGCQVTAPSLYDASKRVSRIQLEAELERFLAQAEIRFEQIDREETLRRELLNHALVIGQSGTVNLVGLVPIAMSILGIGAVADNVRQRKKTKKNSVDNST